MERWATAQFRVIRINRWSLALVLIAALTLLLLPTRKLLPVLGSSSTVSNGVTLWNRDFSGLTESQARVVLADMAEEFQALPVSAREALDAKGQMYVVPELNGYTLDLESTWYKLRLAAPGSSVAPVLLPQAPPVRLADYPAAPIRTGNPGKHAVGLLINVDWGTEHLPPMLAALKIRGAKATFFVSGNWANKNKELLAQIAQEGHEVGTHGHLLTTGPKALAHAGKLRQDIERSVATIQSITGKPVRYYAPHLSEISPEILQTAADLKLRTVLYTLDTVDWRDTTSTDMIMATLRMAKAGDLILMHPKGTTARVLEAGIQQLQSRGLSPQTLSDVISPEPGVPSLRSSSLVPHE